MSHCRGAVSLQSQSRPLVHEASVRELMVFSSMLSSLVRALHGGSRIPRNTTIGRDVYIGGTAVLDWRFGHLITIDDEATVVDGARILCHDASSNRRVGVTLCAPVKIGKRAYIGADALIMPGVTVGDDAVVGAGAVVTRDVEPGSVVVGVPAKQVCLTSELDLRRVELLESLPVFGSEYARRDLSHEQLHELRGAAERGGYFLGTPRQRP